LPVAAYGGRRDIMKMVAPLGPVYQAGTLSGNPLAMRAGLATLPLLEKPGFYDDLNRKTAHLVEGFRAALSENGMAGQVNAVGSLVTLFFSGKPVRNYADAKKADSSRFAAFFSEMLRRGIFLPPSQFEAVFVSAAHTNADMERTIEACRDSLKAIHAAAPAD
jgi:glutamate-1-semialdehyde 2,1-aminomutase